MDERSDGPLVPLTTAILHRLLTGAAVRYGLFSIKPVVRMGGAAMSAMLEEREGDRRFVHQLPRQRGPTQMHFVMSRWDVPILYDSSYPEDHWSIALEESHASFASHDVDGHSWRRYHPGPWSREV